MLLFKFLPFSSSISSLSTPGFPHLFEGLFGARAVVGFHPQGKADDPCIEGPIGERAPVPVVSDAEPPVAPFDGWILRRCAAVRTLVEFPGVLFGALMHQHPDAPAGLLNRVDLIAQPFDISVEGFDRKIDGFGRNPDFGKTSPDFLALDPISPGTISPGTHSPGTHSPGFLALDFLSPGPLALGPLSSGTHSLDPISPHTPTFTRPQLLPGSDDRNGKQQGCQGEMSCRRHLAGYL